MTPQEKAKELIDKYKASIGESDFHIPEFITGVKCADGSKQYTEILERETLQLAKIQAAICVDEIIAERGRISGYNLEEENEEGYQVTNRSEYWEEVKQEIQKL